MKTSLVILALAATLGASHAATPPAEEYYNFADSLYSTGDYYRAITEYERFVFVAPSNNLAPAAQFKIGMSYFSGSKLETAASQFSDVRNDHPGTPAGKAAAIMLGETYYKMGLFGKAETVWSGYVQQYPRDEQVDSVRLKQSLCLLRLGEKKSATDTASAVPAESLKRRSAADIVAAFDDYDQIPQKSPRTAAALSALLPGAGQLYADRPHDAMISFGLNGLMIWGAVAAFDNDEKVTGTFLVVMESIWYVGNIYNAANSANKYNLRQKNNFFDNLRIKCGLMGQPEGLEAAGLGFSVGSKF